jgi:3-deoxy-7-phosphoheptulonate synthase
MSISLPPIESTQKKQKSNESDYPSDHRITEYTPLPKPIDLVSSLRTSLVDDTRKVISNIIHGNDKRLAVFVGPCSIHSENSAIEFAMRLKSLQMALPHLLLVMRFFVQKPRTTIGWTGFLDDPDLTGEGNIVSGLKRINELAYAIVNDIGCPICTELLGTTIEPQFINPYISAGFIGARTSESQIHRNLASGVSFPIGIKNPSDGSPKVAHEGVVAARAPHSFCGINSKGEICAVKTSGNEDAFVVLRGSYKNGPNIKSGLEQLKDKKVAIMVDCSHGNSNKNLDTQYSNALYAAKQPSVCGIMIESHIEEGKQHLCPEASPNKSVTDPCLGWERTEELLRKI